jgi:glycosyltransferase involved in cell wall biosynthesis
MGALAGHCGMADPPVWFWQRIVSPHMAVLAAALAAQRREVTYIAEQEMSADRAAQGWRAPDIGAASLRFAPTADAVREAVRDAPENSIHICQGLRGNGLVSVAQEALARRGLRQWAIMETIDDSGWCGLLKRMEYRRVVRQWRSSLEGVLAIGHATPDWLTARGMPSDRIVPFAYFLSESQGQDVPRSSPAAPFRFLYVGRLIELKRVDLLLNALGKLAGADFELTLVGSGPKESILRAAAEKMLPGRVHWLGQRSIDEIPLLMADADCLVLPSRYDGWGAVLSEALMAGTPAICSDACGAAGVVRASGGSVFPAGDASALRGLLSDRIARGPQTPHARRNLAAWASCLGAKAGADYLKEIIFHTAGDGKRLSPPWGTEYAKDEDQIQL